MQDYNLGKIIENSLKLAWKHKILWVLVLTMGSAGLGRGFSYFGNSLSDLRDQNDQKEVPQYPPVVPSTETPLIPPTLDYLETLNQKSNQTPLLAQNLQEQNFSSVPTTAPLSLSPWPDLTDQFRNNAGLVALAGVSVLFLTLISIAIVLITQGWALGALLKTVDSAILNNPYKLKDIGTNGRLTTKEFIKYRVFLTLITFLVVLILFAPVTIVLSDPTSITQMKTAGIIYSVVVSIGLLTYVVIIGFSDKFAMRNIAIKGLNYKSALIEGFKIFKSNFIKSIVLAFANCFVSGILLIGIFMVLFIGGALIAAIAGGFGTVAFKESTEAALKVVFLALGGIVGIPLIFAFIAGMLGLSGYLATYNHFTWSMLFNFATGRGLSNGNGGQQPATIALTEGPVTPISPEGIQNG